MRKGALSRRDAAKVERQQRQVEKKLAKNAKRVPAAGRAKKSPVNIS